MITTMFADPAISNDSQTAYTDPGKGEVSREVHVEPLMPGLRRASEAGIHVWSRLLRRLGGRRFDGCNNIYLGHEKLTPVIPMLKFTFHSIARLLPLPDLHFN